jgi:hypothetical protein
MVKWGSTRSTKKVQYELYNIIIHIKGLKERNHMIFFINTEKSSGKSQCPFWILKLLNKTGTDGTYLTL